jgi:predicted dehydrogenase
VNTYQAEIEDFCLAILDKRKPLNDELIGFHSQRLIDACYQSAKSGKSIEIVDG